MPRRLRDFVPGEPIHLTARGVDELRIFLSDFDRLAFLALLRRVTERVRWHLAVWCLMDTHYHLIVFPADEARVPRAMQALNSVYAREFNHRHGRRGHVFGERYSHTGIASASHLRAACDYVLDNPVRAGLVRNALDWAWSGDHRLEPRLPEVGTKPVHFRDRAVRRRG